MNSLRIWVLALVVWLPLMVSVEHTLVLQEYRHNILLFLLCTVAVVLMAPKPLHTRLTVFGLVIAFIAIGILQNGIGDELENLYLTATRIGAIFVTGLIAHQINTHLYRVEEAITAYALSDVAPLPAAFSDAQVGMYRELQRARHHGRPLSLVMLKIDEEEQEQAIPEVAEELRQSMVHKFMLAKLARILNDHLPRFHSFALRDDAFIAALPETSAAEASDLIASLGVLAARELGVTVHAGIASLSDEMTTFESLVDVAEARMKHAQSAPDLPDSIDPDFHAPTETPDSASTPSSPDHASELVFDTNSHLTRSR